MHLIDYDKKIEAFSKEIFFPFPISLFDLDHVFYLNVNIKRGEKKNRSLLLPTDKKNIYN